MLQNPRLQIQPGSSGPSAAAASSSTSRPPVPLIRSSTSASLAQMSNAPAPLQRQPLAAIQPYRVAEGLASRPQKPAQAATTRRSTSPPERPAPPPAAETAVPNRVPATQLLQNGAAPAKEKEKEKARSKLSEQWAEPPKRVRREDVWLDRGQLLGEGGFARVYLCTEPDGVTYKALKVIDKQQLKSTQTKSKLFAEIKIHQAMAHANIISFEHCFEDDGNVYMQLELCANGSMLDVLRIRKRYSEPEARFYLTQLVGACDYMHSNSVIHRDLKLGNLMLDQNMDLRVGDFGLAALVKFPGERKKTICGTPNYIAPEILFDQQGGHSFEVDIWSIGVILYTLLIGRPPFQTKDVKAIYKKIRDNSYTFPADHGLSDEAVDLVTWILSPTPAERPTLAEILAHPWFTCGPFPARISSRALDPERSVGLLEEWRYMSKKQAWDNFRRCKRRAGIVEAEGGDAAQGTSAGATAPAPAVVSQALPAVAEAAEEDAEQDAAVAAPASSSAGSQNEPVKRSKSSMRIVRAEEEKDAKGRMEKEVRSATAPESPISELLRSARKPLLVSPASRGIVRAQHPPERRPVISTAGTLQQRLHAAAPVMIQPAASSTAGTSIVPASSNAGAPSASGSGTRNPPRQPDFERPRTTSGSSASTRAGSQKESNSDGAPNTPRPRHRRAGATAQAAVPVPAPTAGGPRTTVHPSRSLYDATWRSFDAFLGCKATADVAAVSASVIDSLPSDEAQQAPRVFITSWVDYTHKYGTAYSLTDGTAGLYFNDSTTMVLSPDKEHFDYISNRKDNVYTRRHYSISSKPEELDRKAYLLQYFEDYMAKTLRRDVAWLFEDVERKKNMDFLVKYYRMKQAIVFKMSNDVLQFNFYDHYKLIITYSGLLLTFIDPNFTQTTFTLPSLFRLAAAHGHYAPRHAPSEELKRIRIFLEKVGYCRDVLRTLVNRKSSSSAAPAA